MATELSFNSVRDFIASHGGRVKNTLLVAHFRKFINDPQNKDIARQKFKEYVNAVAAVRTEDGEKYVQLKRKFRTDEPSEPPVQNTTALPPSGHHKTEPPEVAPTEQQQTTKPHSAPPQEKPSPKSHHKLAEKSFSPSKMEAVPYADGTMETDVAKGDQGKKVFDSTKKTEDRQKIKIDDVAFKKPGTPPSQARKGSKTAALQQQLQQQPKQTDKQQPVINKLPSRPSPVQIRDANAARPAPSPTSRKREMLRSQKPRRDISGPSDLVPSGAVERARQNFQTRKNEDSSSIAPSEKSVDSKEAEQDDEDDRTQPSYIMDAVDKQWMLRSAQCNMVEIRKMLNADPTLADKRDFFLGYTALHWAVKRGNIDLTRMFCEADVDINARTNGGYTPLHLAAQQGHDKIMQLLIEEFDCNTTLRDYSGHLARDYVKPGTISLPIQSRRVYKKRKKIVVATNGTWRDRGKNSFQIIDAISHIKTIPRGVFAIINDRTNNIVRRKKGSIKNNDEKSRNAPERRNSFTHDLAGQIGNWVSNRSSFRRSGKNRSGKTRTGSTSSLNNAEKTAPATKTAPPSKTALPSKTAPAFKPAPGKEPNYLALPKSNNVLSWKPAGKKS